MPEITLLDVFLPIFSGMGPVKVLLVYMALTKDSSSALQRKVAQKTILTATIIAIVLLMAGAFIMRLLHFTAGALTIAGGLLLLILSIVLRTLTQITWPTMAHCDHPLQTGLPICLS
jgi:multiple antibiotic resistance protein